MPEQKKKVTSDTTKVESPKIPNVAYPLKPRSNSTNLSQQYFNHLAGDESARFLFNNSGLWHQGIHLRASKFPSSEFENNKICAIADGKLIAYKVDREYKTDAKSESSKASAVYSTGFFLLKHEVAYPKDNVLTFYSLYRHTAKLSDYKSGIEELVGITKSADNKIVIRDAQNQPLNPRVELKNDVTIGVRRNTKGQEQFDELLWYRETQGNKTIEHKPKSGEHWRIFHQSYEEMQSEQIKGLPLLSKHKIDTQADVEVKLNKAIAVKAGEELGLMGEYNQIGESGEKLLHLEVFTYDNIEQFPQLFDKYFKCCGWDVRLKSGEYVAYYNDVTGAELKNIIRNGYTADTYGKFVPNKAVAIFAEAIDTDEYKELQVLDFIDRLRLALNIIPKGYSYQIASYVKSNLGKATVLDHHVNRPNNVSKYFGIALDSFFSKNPNVSKNPNTWGALHNKYEKEIIDYYGVNRDGTDMPTRYMELKKKL